MLSAWDFGEVECEMMRQANKAFIVEVGLAGNIIQCNFTKFGDLATKGTWFHNLWEFVCHLNEIIKFNFKFQVQLARLGDIPIMKMFAKDSLHLHFEHSPEVNGSLPVQPGTL